MTKSDFIRMFGIEVYNDVKTWKKEIDDVEIYSSIEDIEEDYGVQLNDANDIFEHFGNHVRAVVATGDFIIDKKF